MYKIKKRKITRPELSIIIPIKDQTPFLDRCLASLEKVKDVTFELILVNDGSNVETIHYLERFPQLDIIHNNKQSEGFISSCHKGILKSISNHILLLNSDTELIEPTSFRKMLDVFKFNKNVGIVGARLALENNTLQHAGLVWDAGQMNYMHRYYGKDMNDPVACVNEVVDVVTGACFLTTRELWNKLGGFDRIYGKGYFEDTDYCLRAKELGYFTVYCGEALLYHYQSRSFVGGPSKEHFTKNHQTFLNRWVRTGKICKYPKIVACYITKDSEDFLEASMRSVYDMVSKIIVIDNNSKDRTLEILEKFNDPQKKLIVISKEFKDKTEQRNVYCQMLDNMDYAWIIDSDEVWDGENLRKVEHLIFSNPLIQSFCWNFYDFWKDLGHLSKGIWESFVGRKSLINLNIVGRIKYDIHTLPIRENGEEIYFVFFKDIYFFHYGYVRSNEKIKNKIDYYVNTGTPGFPQQKDYYEKIWLGWDINKNEVESKYGTHLFGGGHTELWAGDHPEVMRNHPRFLEYIHKYKLKINMTVFPLQRDGFVNVSSKNNNIFETSLIMDNNKPFLVFIEDLLEHISFNTVGEFLIRIYDQMEINGEIIIKTLNLPEVIKRYVEGNAQYVDFIKLIYGDQTEANDCHSCCYDEAAIKILLGDVGFSNITVDKMENGLYLYIVGRKSKEYQKSQ